MAIIKAEFFIDSDLKEQAESVLKELGLDMSVAIDIFLRRCVSDKRLPLEYNQKTMKALEEAMRISGDDSVPGYDNIEDLIKALES